MSKVETKKLSRRSSKSEVDAFLDKVAATTTTRKSGRCGRLIFAMDATASREPTWDQACHIQGEMFAATADLGGLAVQLCYYRGFHGFDVSAWMSNARDLLASMTTVSCAGGTTQIARVLDHAIAENARDKVNALVFVGDCMEEDVDKLCQQAGELGLVRVPIFVFQEGFDLVAEKAFREMARLSGGAYCHFDARSAQQLRDLLSAVAVFAAGGHRALEDFGRQKGGVVQRLTHDLRRA